MATWQFDIHLVPSCRVVGDSAPGKETASSELKDFSVAWKGFSMANDLILALSRLLPKSDSWTSEIDTWGQAEGHRIEILREQADIADIRVRVDIKSCPELFLKNLIPIAIQFGLVMIDDQYHVIKPTEHEVLTSMRRSSAFRFVHDAHAYLDDLRRKEKRRAN